MKKIEVELAVKRLENAFKRLKCAIELAKSDLEKDGAIHRFEFTVELL